MALKSIRNHANLPHLSTEGSFSKPLEKKCGSEWWKNLKPYERMHTHHTLASVRRYAHFHPHPNLIPINSLDLSLSSTYDHAQEHFPDPVDPILQPETLGLSTWRRLRNSKFVLPGEDPRTASLKELCGTDDGDGKAKKQLACQDKYAVNHPVLIGGIMERKHPSYVKLMNSSHHAPQTNAGFSRQTGDGNIFVY